MKTMSRFVWKNRMIVADIRILDPEAKSIRRTVESNKIRFASVESDIDTKVSWEAE
jgi:hypothetical protein